MKIILSMKSIEVLKLIAANGGAVGKTGFGREGRALENRGLVMKTKAHYKITAAGRKYLDKVPF